LERYRITSVSLVYIEVYVFNGIVSNNLIDHLKIFHIAIFILSHPKLSVQLCNYAQSLLIQFVKNFDDFYGPGSKIYNIHSLIHIPDVRCKKFWQTIG